MLLQPRTRSRRNVTVPTGVLSFRGLLDSVPVPLCSTHLSPALVPSPPQKLPHLRLQDPLDQLLHPLPKLGVQRLLNGGLTAYPAMWCARR
jgi:hypothetical protein